MILFVLLGVLGLIVGCCFVLVLFAFEFGCLCLLLAV